MKILNIYNIQFKTKDLIDKNLKSLKQKISHMKLNYDIFYNLYNNQKKIIKTLKYFNFINIIFVTSENKFNIFFKFYSLKQFILNKLNILNIHKNDKIILKYQIFDIAQYKLINFNNININIMYINIINNIKQYFNKIKII